MSSYLMRANETLTIYNLKRKYGSDFVCGPANRANARAQRRDLSVELHLSLDYWLPQGIYELLRN
jgi:hypothetical protein